MKRLGFYFLCILLYSSAVRAETITIAADVWCPFNCGETDEKKGAMIELAEAAFAKHRIKVKYVVTPWNRAISEAREGKFTAIVGAAKDDAPDFVFPSVEQSQMRNAFYVKEGNAWRYAGLKSLEGVSVGTIAEYSYHPDLDGYFKAGQYDMKKVQVMHGDGALEKNIKKLLAGRIDALIESESVMNYTLNKFEQTGMVEMAGYVPTSDNDQLFVAFSPVSKNAQRYAEILAKETQAMRANGELDSILARYGLKDWKK